MPRSYESGGHNFKALGAATRVRACRLATFTQLPASLAKPTPRGWMKGHSRRLGLEGGAPHLRCVLNHIKYNGLQMAQRLADGAQTPLPRERA